MAARKSKRKAANGKEKRQTKRPKTEAQKAAFLAAYLETATISHAAREIGISNRRHYEWLEADPEYAERFAEAQEEATDTLEKEARRRAVDGVREPVGWYKGEPGGYVTRYSDTLLIFLLKGFRPDRYRDRHEVSGPGGAPLEASVDWSKLPTPLLKKVLEALENS